jgi:hypothetical protein
MQPTSTESVGVNHEIRSAAVKVDRSSGRHGRLSIGRSPAIVVFTTSAPICRPAYQTSGRTVHRRHRWRRLGAPVSGNLGVVANGKGAAFACGRMGVALGGGQVTEVQDVIGPTRSVGPGPDQPEFVPVGRLQIRW